MKTQVASLLLFIHLLRPSCSCAAASGKQAKVSATRGPSVGSPVANGHSNGDSSTTDSPVQTPSQVLQVLQVKYSRSSVDHTTSTTVGQVITTSVSTGSEPATMTRGPTARVSPTVDATTQAPQSSTQIGASSTTGTAMAPTTGSEILQAHTTPNATKTANMSGSTNITKKKKPLDACAKWEQCSIHKHPRVLAWFKALPACPCTYPRTLSYSGPVIHDPVHRRNFRWRRVSNVYEKMHVYQPNALYCIRQSLTSHSTAVQKCCYDYDLKLITRGSSVGTPNMVSPEVGFSIHDKVDLMPWRSCRGDWTRYHNVRPPNNALNCTQNPDDRQFALERKKAIEY